MKYFILNCQDDDGYVLSQAVRSNNGSTESLYTDYNEILDSVTEKNPEEWSLNDIFTQLEKRGWEFVDAPVVTVNF